MTAQAIDLKVLEDLIRKVVREEIRNVIQETSVDEFVSEDEFAAATQAIFKKHKKVLDALA